MINDLRLWMKRRHVKLLSLIRIIHVFLMPHLMKNMMTVRQTVGIFSICLIPVGRQEQRSPKERNPVSYFEEVNILGDHDISNID
jgi:hypothetical protein